MEKNKQVEINEVIKANFGIKTYRELGEMLGMTPEAIRGRARRMGLAGNKSVKEQDLPIEKKVEVDIFESRSSKKLKETSQKYSYLTKKVEELERQIEAVKTIKDVSSFKFDAKKNEIGSATAVIVASDWHYWERVEPDHIDGLNEFNKEVAEERAKQFFKNSVTLLKREQRDSDVKTAIFALLGDFISGNIHDELLETNEGLIIDEVMAVQKALCSGIEYMLKNTNVNFIIPCNSGNHGRITQKRRVASEAGNSLEYYMYHTIATYFKNEPRLKFIISKGYMTYIDIAGYVIRFHHGHNIRYGGGIGGIFIPAFKAIAQWNKGKRADLDVFGHFHQIKDGGCFLSNGSLVGYNDFALSIKADYEKPKQLFFLINHKRNEKTTTCPIFLEEQDTSI